MSSRMQSAVFALLMLTASLAQTASAADRRPDPADPLAVVPPPRYVSDFASYRQPQFEQKLDWRQANDTVRETGGHAGALKDAPKQPAGQMPAHHGPAHHGPAHHGPAHHGPADHRPAMHHGHTGHGGHRP